MRIMPSNAKTRAWLNQAAVALQVVSIVLYSFGVVFPAGAGEPERTLQDGLHLMAVSQTILAGEIESELEYVKANGAMAPASRAHYSSVEEQQLVAMINAVKGEIATLIKECNETRRLLAERDEQCAVSTLDTICEEGKRELRNTLSLLRQIRGDRRKLFTRMGASLKRAGKSIWRAVGPVGRRILRSLGEEVVQAVASPGGVQVRALRIIIRSRLKSLARKEIRGAIQRGAERLIMKKWEVARGPTGDQCIEGGDTAESKEEPLYDKEDWFDEVWRDMEALLVLGRQNCQKTAIVELRRCLLDHAASGTSAEDAINACEAIMNAIPKNDAGGSVTMTGQVIFGDAVPNEATIAYLSSGGEAKGNIYFQRYDDVFGCTFTTTTTLVGQYDPETCTMRGQATSEFLYEGYCVSVCGPAPSFPTSCPVTISRTCVWEATLEDGVLSGTIGDESCDRGYQFRAPGYGF